MKKRQMEYPPQVLSTKDILVSYENILGTYKFSDAMNDKSRLAAYLARKFDLIQRLHFKMFLNDAEIYHCRQTGIDIRTARKIIFREIAKSALPDCLVLLDYNGVMQVKNDCYPDVRDLYSMIDEIRQICISNENLTNTSPRISVEEFDSYIDKILTSQIAVNSHVQNKKCKCWIL